jgi:hypothetical protein
MSYFEEETLVEQVTAFFPLKGRLIEELNLNNVVQGN